jgi:L-seryl-tRNA(Ser) seleniumtransferase
MKSSDDKQPFRSIPSVDELLGAPEISALRGSHPHFPWTHLARRVTSDVRAGKLGELGGSRGDVRARLVAAMVSRADELRTGGTKRVINGTGVVLNTNLGRAILPPEAVDAAREAMMHYVSLEIDLASGKRGHRGEVLEELVVLATQAECAMIVNNNAAAVWLAVSSFSPPGRVIVSRGELVEIGGSFRLPDILARAASEVVEVGTTNRTYAADYAKEARPGDLFLKVHRSNYEIQGFTHEADVGDLVGVAADKKCSVVFDLGSGCLFDFASRGLGGETRGSSPDARVSSRNSGRTRCGERCESTRPRSPPYRRFSACIFSARLPRRRCRWCARRPRESSVWQSGRKGSSARSNRV